MIDETNEKTVEKYALTEEEIAELLTSIATYNNTPFVADCSLRDLKVREWVKQEYPKEWAARQIKSEVTFREMNDAMNSGKGLYETISTSKYGLDTAVREVVFRGLAIAYGYSINQVNQWWFRSVEPKRIKKPKGVRRFKK